MAVSYDLLRDREKDGIRAPSSYRKRNNRKKQS